MKIFTASQELVDLLTSHGFIDITEKHYPQHAVRFKDRPYNADGAKRNFGYPGTRKQILFDYINIRISSKCIKSMLTELELKALITYFKLSASDRSRLDIDGYDVLDMIEIYDNVKRSPEIYSKSYYQRIIASIDSLTLN